ncbi:phosphatase PAP2 family protein [Streptomyces sp. BHT-5-2]|uniref:phosphatase PAP2 family protein n=1 Tax=unclassified Streptomyces TaxID=2593676 RepID=UPI001C8CF798|nr:phosphatase PAP2 family protein [Streptomyces sp. BHT-5-2]QZL04039.1 phosphatase PAP2 family protein [Streptomyces sp. BHT-5-2]
MTDLAFGGASIDGGLYTSVTGFAQDMPHFLNVLVSYWTDLGLGVFALMMLVAWWRARQRLGGSSRRRLARGEGRHTPAVTMAMALAVPVVVVLAYVANDVVKAFFHEQRPCQTLHDVVTVEPCPGLGDWSFPSNHSAIAASAAIALLLLDRRIGALAVPAALLMGASRVWVGAHYPHDVVVGLVVGSLVAAVLMPLARRAAPLVERVRETPLRPLVATR